LKPESKKMETVEERKHIAGNLTGEALQQFESVRAQLSHGETLTMSDANVIRFLLKKYFETFSE
jgi:hypothetical protein